MDPPARPTQLEYIEAFTRASDEIGARHMAQSADTVRGLREKYARPALGRVPVWGLVEKLGQCIDPTDQIMFGASQQLHVLQVLEAMEIGGDVTEESVVAALVHDLGKILLLTGEAPENVVCRIFPVGDNTPGAGLDRCLLQWGHGEFAYMRLKSYLPDGLAWLVRYHNIVPEACAPYMDERDRVYAERYLRPFAYYDNATKSAFYVPQRRIDHYRPVIERVFPWKIIF